MKNNMTILRPDSFNNFIGQEKIIESLKIIIESSKKNNKMLDHTIFYGPPGRGKTTLANIIGNEFNKKIIYVQGSLLEKKSDILSLFAGLPENSIIFIDEIHSINKGLEELIYSVMEDNVIDIPIGPEGERKIIRMKVKNFTLIGSTTEFSRLSFPLRDRFGLHFKLANYTNDDIAKIIIQSCDILNHSISYEHSLIVASFSQNTPRIANRLIKRIIEFADYYNEGGINEKIIYQTFKNLSIYREGLTEIHIEYLNLLYKTFEGKTTSLDVISSLICESKKMVINEIEPILLSKKYVIKTSRGRKITTLGIEYINNYKRWEITK